MSISRPATRSSPRLATAHPPSFSIGSSTNSLQSRPRRRAACAQRQGTARRSTRTTTTMTTTAAAASTTMSTSTTAAASVHSEIPRRSSTRRAAIQAKERISTVSQRRALAPPRPGSSKSPIVLDGSDEEDEVENDGVLKPAAVAAGSGDAAAASAPGMENILEDFTCPICLDCPESGEDLAKISGCSHKFCYDCIDRWANTENRCPCCKERFRSIERVVPVAVAAAQEIGRKRKRGRAGSGRSSRARRGEAGAAASAAAASAGSGAASARVNSRSVEDRNQPVPGGPPISTAMLQQIVASLRQMGPLRRHFSTDDGMELQVGSVGGVPMLRISSPRQGGGMGVLEFMMNVGEPGAGAQGGRTLSLSLVRRSSTSPSGRTGAGGRVGRSPSTGRSRSRRSPSTGRAASRPSRSPSNAAAAAPADAAGGDVAERERRHAFIARPRSRSRAARMPSPPGAPVRAPTDRVAPAAAPARTTSRRRQRAGGEVATNPALFASVMAARNASSNSSSGRASTRRSARNNTGSSRDEPVILDD